MVRKDDRNKRCPSIYGGKGESPQAITYHVPLNDDIDGLHEEHPGHTQNHDTDKNLLSVGLGRRDDMLALVLLLEWTHTWMLAMLADVPNTEDSVTPSGEAEVSLRNM